MAVSRWPAPPNRSNSVLIATPFSLSDLYFKIISHTPVDFHSTPAITRYNRQGGLTHMQYLLLIYGSEMPWNDIPKDELGKMYGEYTAFTKAISASGNYIGGNPLQP